VQPLPIDPLLPDLVRLVREQGAVVLEAPPGAGKTTRVPTALLDGLDGTGEIVVLERRRLAARMAARRVADERGERLGDTIGYQVRFEDVTSSRTRVRFVTEGVLTRKLLGDPTLSGVQAVVLDEFHERHLHGDVALALVHRLRRMVRPDLRVVVMSATLGVAPVAAYLGAATLRSEGRMYEVTLEHAEKVDDRPLASQVASAVRSALRGSEDGHVLVFLPGAGEIRKARDACTRVAEEHQARLLPLHGDLSPAEQDRAVGPSRERKIVLATNVAESSVTIEGVVAVVDSGLARVAEQLSWSGLPTRKTAKISRASATQRAGRAGRTRAGRCLRLYTLGDFQTRAAFDLPEIARIDLAQTYLELAASNALDLDWFEAPPEPAMRAARTLLERLGALDGSGAITALGKRIAHVPLHPRQARVLLEAERLGVREDGAVVAALLGERDLRLEQRAAFSGGARSRDSATEPSDVTALLGLYREAEASGFSESILRSLELDSGKTRAVARAAEKLAPRRSGGRARGESQLSVTEIDEALQRALLTGYPDRVARRGKGRALALAFGGTAELSEGSVVRDAPWLVGVDAELDRGKVVVRLASAIEPEWLIDLAPELIVEEDVVAWDSGAERVLSRSRMTWGGLVLSESEGAGGSMAASDALAKAAIEAGWRSFDPNETVSRWLARVRFVGEHDASVVAPTEEDVHRALRGMAEGLTSFRELRAAGLFQAVEGLVPAGVASRLRALAPERIQLPGGRSLEVHYEPGKPPWAESRLQDFFGMADTPRLGTVPLVLHLLAPNARAVQVTTDLAGFWTRHYPAIRKELGRKYPRHSWPEDPRNAVPPAPRAPRR